MKCPSCGYVSFQSTGECVKCGAPTPTSASGTDNDADFRRGVRRKDRDQLGFTFPDDQIPEAETIATAVETQATLSATKTRAMTQAAAAPEPVDDEDSSYGSGTHWEADSESASEANTWVEVYRVASGFGRRALAMLIDAAVFVVFFAILLYALQGGGEFQMLGTAHVPAFLFLLVLHGFYFTFFHAATGQTPGKMLFGIRVVSIYGAQLLTPWDAFMRWIGYFLSAAPLGLGYVWAILDHDDRALHDRWAKSVVVVVDSQTAPPPAA